MMLSSKVIKFSSPVARSTLVANSIGILIVSIAIIYYACRYPYLFDSEEGLEGFYLRESRSITITFTILSVCGIFVAFSTLYTSYGSGLNYTLFHASLVGIYVPTLIAAYILTSAARYDTALYLDQSFIDNYRLHGHFPSSYKEPEKPHIDAKKNINNLTDLIQERFVCCGKTSSTNWEVKFNHFIPKSCCDPASRLEKKITDKPEWGMIWKLDEDVSIEYCSSESAHDRTGCFQTIKDLEDKKSDRLGILNGVLGVLCIANAVLSLLVYGLMHIEKLEAREHEEMNELSIIGSGALDPTSLKPRPSISSEKIAVRALAVRFNLSNSPRQSISGPPRFSAAARRQSSFI